MTERPQDSSRAYGTPIRILVVTACVVVLVAGLRAASSIIEPFLIALFVVLLSLPILFWLARRLPTTLAVVGTILLDLVVLAAVGSLVGTTVTQLAEGVDKYQGRLTELVDDGSAWLEERGIRIDWLSAPAEPGEIDGPGAPVPADGASSGIPQASESLLPGLLSRLDASLLSDFTNQTLRYTASALSSLLIIALIVVFMLSEAATFRAKVQLAFPGVDTQERFAEMTHEIQHYIGIKTTVSAATGLLIGVWVGVLGVDFAIFWGLVAFVLNFIPNLGSIIAAVPPTLLAMVQIDVGRGLVVALGYLVVNVVIGNFIEPHLMGRRLGLSTLVVVLSLVFWGWVWGPIGMLLSVPLTMVLKIMLENTEEFRWVAVMLGDRRAAIRLFESNPGKGEP